MSTIRKIDITEVTEKDVAYFVDQLNECDPSDTLRKRKLEKMIELLKDSIVIYRLKSPERN
jgi:hypothetical protein